MTVGGDKLDAFQDIHSPTIDITNTKIHQNSTISDAHRGAQYCTVDVKDFFLNSTMPIFQYMRLHCHYIMAEVMTECKFSKEYFDSKGHIYLEIRKGVYGL